MVKWWVVSSGFEKKTLKIAQQKIIEIQKDTVLWSLKWNKYLHDKEKLFIVKFK